MNEITLPPASLEPITRDQHIVGLTTSNFQKVKLIRLAFDEKNPAGLVTISGSNGEGKTSLILSVVAALTKDRCDRRRSHRGHRGLQYPVFDDRKE